MSVLFKSRKALACLPAICLLAVAVHSAMESDLKITPKYDDSTVEIALIDPEALQPPPEPEPEPLAEPPPPPPPPEEVVEAPVIEEPPPPPPKPKPPLPKPQPPKPKPQVVKAAPKPPAPQPVAQAPQPAPPPVAAAPKPAPAPRPAAAPQVNQADMETRYIARLLAELERYKQYPRGREASLQRPQGNVVVWLLIDRGGNVLDSGIEKKATNMLLNRAAQTSLRRLDKVTPFPDNTFSGKDKYRFSATLVYNIED